MTRLAALAATTIAALLLAPPAAGALEVPFGIEKFDVGFADQHGEAVTQAGSHPFAMSTSVRFDANKSGAVEEALKDLIATQPAGFVGNPTAVPPCQAVDFLQGSEGAGCPDSSAVGTVSLQLTIGGVGGVS
jgi:hypothetical protein